MLLKASMNASVIVGRTTEYPYETKERIVPMIGASGNKTKALYFRLSILSRYRVVKKKALKSGITTHKIEVAENVPRLCSLFASMV